MFILVFTMVCIPFLLCILFPSISSEILEISRVREVRICFSFVLQVCLLIYTFSSERVETNRTQRMRFRSVSFVTIILGIAFLALSVMSLFGWDNLNLSIMNAGYEFGSCALIYFSALIIYNIVFKILILLNLD